MTHDLNEQLLDSYQPMMAIVAYKSAQSYAKDKYYLESHLIGDKGQLLEGRPLNSKTIAGIVEAFKEQSEIETKISGAIPSCLLHFTPGTAGNFNLVWYRPAQQVVMYFTDNFKLKSGKAWVPPTLFVATASHLHVYALPSGRRPGPTTKVLPAPFPNVNAEGRVCLGSAKAKVPVQKTFANLIEYWETMFWGSKFSAVHNQNALTTDMVKVWRKQLAKPALPFPVNLIVKTKRTFQDIIDGKIKIKP